MGVEADERGGHKGEGYEVGERVPVPVLREHEHGEHGGHPWVARLGPEADGHVPPAGVNDALRHDGAHLGHRHLSIVLDVVHQPLAERRQGLFGLLHHHHGHGDERTLLHKVNRIGEHGLEECDSLLHARAGARDAHSHRGAVAHVGVVRLREELNDPRALARGGAQHETQRHHRGPSNVVGHVGHGDVQEAADARVVSGGHVRRCGGEARAVADDRVAVAHHLLDEGLGLLLAAVRGERQADGAPADDLLVLRLVAVVENLLLLVAGAGAREEQAHADAGTLARDGTVSAEDSEHVGEHLLVAGAERCQTEAEARAVLDNLVVAGAGRLEQKGQDTLAVVGVDETERVQGAALGVGARARTPGAALAGQEGSHQRAALVELPAVNHAHPRRRREPRPVRRPAEPVEVLPEESIHGGARVHQRVAEHGRGVAHGVPGLHRGTHLLEQQEVGGVVRVQKLEVEVDGELAGEHRAEQRDGLLLLLRLLLLVFLLVLLAILHGGVLVGAVLARGILGRGRQLGRDVRKKLLNLILAQGEGDLVRQELILLLALDKPGEDSRYAVRVVQEHEALAHVQVVVLHVIALVHAHQHREHLAAKLPRRDERLAHPCRVVKRLRHVGALVDGLLQLVQALGLERDSDGLVDLTVVEAPLEHPLDDGHEPRVDRLLGFGLLPLLDVLVDRLGCGCGSGEGSGGSDRLFAFFPVPHTGEKGLFVKG